MKCKQMGRTGEETGWIEHWDIEPEVMAFAKEWPTEPLSGARPPSEIADNYPGLSFSTLK